MTAFRWLVVLWLGLAACPSPRSPQTAVGSSSAITAAEAASPGPAAPACGPSPGPTLAPDRTVTAAVAFDDGTVLLTGYSSAHPVRPWSALLKPRSGPVTEVAMPQDLFVERLARTTTGIAIALAGRRPGQPVTESARFDVATRTWHALPAVPACVSEDAPSLREQYPATTEIAALSDGGALVVGHRCAVRLSASGAWGHAPSPPPARGFTLTRLAQGDLVRVGGLRTMPDDFDLEATRDVYRFDFRAYRWSPVAPSPYFRYNHTATTLPDGRLLVSGGCEDSGTICHAENRPAPPATIYDPVTDRWEVLGGGPITNRERSTATVLADGRAVIVGGFVDDSGVVVAPSAQYRDGRWSELPGLGYTRAGHTALAAGDHIFLAGAGWDDEPQLQWYGASPSCPTTPVTLSPPAPPL